MSVVELPTLDELQQRFAEALTQERDSFWVAAEVAQMALGIQPTRKAKAEAAGQLATVGMCSQNYVTQLAVLAESFGAEYRKPDISMSLYRAVARAAKRLNAHAGELLEQALEKGWHASDVAALGRDTETRSRLHATCAECHARVTVVTTLPAGMRLPCPLCDALAAKREGRALAFTIGVLEVA